MNNLQILLFCLLASFSIASPLFANSCYEICVEECVSVWCPPKAAFSQLPILQRPQYKDGELYVKIRPESSLRLHRFSVCGQIGIATSTSYIRHTFYRVSISTFAQYAPIL
ncbi:MAG: hypothetical protein IPL33_12625 [Sphingobacteriales bacterium]|nr:hypothetical protein [Sphingobacteriales bacterium]